MTKTMKTNKLRGQIMVIVLLLLSVLTIIALTATLTASRDTVEQAQNKQYEQYYALGESMILDLQRQLGTQALSVIPTTFPAKLQVPTADPGVTNQASCNQVDTNDYTCTFDPIAASQVTSGTTSAETLKVQSEIKDTAYIENYNTYRDQDVLINLTPARTESNTTYLIWGDGSVSWDVSYDYLLAGNKYQTDMAVFNAVTGSGVFSNPTTGATMGNAEIKNSGCVKLTQLTSTDPDLAIRSEYATAINGFHNLPPTPYVLKIANDVNCPGNQKSLYFRMRALSTSDAQITISLNKDGNATPLQRTITNITSTGSTTSGSTQQPTAVQQSSYMLVYSPSPLFDYVLRTEKSVDK